MPGWTQAEPNNPMGWYYMAQTLGAEMNQPQNALPTFQRAASLKSPWPEVWNALGHVYAQLERYNESADAFRKATEQNPRRMSYWTNLAGAYSDSNKWDAARKVLMDGQ